MGGVACRGEHKAPRPPCPAIPPSPAARGQAGMRGAARRGVARAEWIAMRDGGRERPTRP
eukprot:scaffold673_cov410-Prasinococcus_capsulatus_cf.AAC.16